MDDCAVPRSIRSLSPLLVLGALFLFAPPVSADETLATAKPCHWWDFSQCENPNRIEGLPDDAPHGGTVITVDVATNRIYLFQDEKLVAEAPAGTATEKVLKRGGRTFLFHTPRGTLKVLRKIEDPVWTKPDWAFLEDGQRIPPLNSPKRRVKGHLGKYALDLGGGIMIHGSDDRRSFGRRVSHGCIRVPARMLETMYDKVRIGTPVYIFESHEVETAANNAKTGERHSDLDF